MDLNDYQSKARITARYPVSQGLVYCALGLCGESGEVADKLKRVYRDHGGDLEAARESIGRELGDVLWYVANLAHELGFTLEQVASMNVEKLRSRTERGVLHGEGDDR